MKKLFATAALAAALLAGCDTSPVMPEVNDENCRYENIKKLPKGVQQEFATKCFLRGEFRPSPPRKW